MMLHTTNELVRGQCTRNNLAPVKEIMIHPTDDTCFVVVCAIAIITIISVYICTCTCVCVYMCLSLSLSVSLSLYLSLSIYLSLSLYIYIYVYTCIYICELLINVMYILLVKAPLMCIL